MKAKHRQKTNRGAANAPKGPTTGRKRGRPARVVFVLAAVLAAAVLAAAGLGAQLWPAGAQGGPMRIPMTSDWSHRHMVYSSPASLLDGLRLSSDARYVQQWLRRYSAAEPWQGSGRDFEDRLREHETRPATQSTMRPDWGFSTPGPGTTALDAVYPAKYSYNTTATPSCTNDFLVMPTGVAGSTTAITAQATAIITSEPTFGSQITIKNGSTSVTLTAGSFTNGLGFGLSSVLSTVAQNLANAINILDFFNSSLGITASYTSGSNYITITAKNAGSASNGISVSSTTNAVTWGGATSNTLQGGADGTASIAAVNNLYSGNGGACSRPAAYWNYNTGGTVVTSPVISNDGTQVAFVQTITSSSSLACANSSTCAALVVLKWAANSTFATLSSNSSYPNCTAPCMVALPFAGSTTPSDTSASPFYIFGGTQAGALYVGDSSGKLHKFLNVFSSSKPAEASSPWPIAVSTASAPALTSAVYDGGSGNVFVGDASGNAWYVREMGSSTKIGGSCARGTTLPCLGATSQALGGSFTDGPTVDGTNETVFWFNGTTNGTIGANSGTATTAMLAQTGTALTLLGSPNAAPVTFSNDSSAIAVPPMHAGDFNNQYYSAAAGAPGSTSKIYVCAPDPDGHDYPALFRVGFTGKAHGNWGTISQLDNSADSGYIQLVSNNSGGSCSPITEVYNSNATTATDWLFLSTGNDSAGPGLCSTGATNGTGCVLSVNLTTLSWPSSWTTLPVSGINGVPQSPGPAYANGRFAPPTGGIIIDNIAPTSGTSGGQYSNLYFLSLPNMSTPGNSSNTYMMCNGIVAANGCNVKLTQAGLQ